MLGAAHSAWHTMGCIFCSSTPGGSTPHTSAVRQIRASSLHEQVCTVPVWHCLGVQRAAIQGSQV